MPDPSPTTSLPVAEAEGGMPEEIEAAIDAYGSAEADSFDLSLSPRKRGLAAKRGAETRAALTTAILSRLTAAEAARDAALKERDEWEQVAKVEAGLRREFLSRAERAEKALEAKAVIEALKDAEWLLEWLAAEKCESADLDLLCDRQVCQETGCVSMKRDAVRGALAALAQPAPTEDA